MSHPVLSRRLFLANAALSSAAVIVPGASALLLGCSSARGEVRAGDASSPPAGPGSATPRSRAVQCAPGAATDANIEGPYYRPGAPFRADLVDPGIVGLPLLLSGAVVSLDCKTPLAGAVIDVWQADASGHYDNDGSMKLPEGALRLRGKVRTDAAGAFAVRTVLPGRYLNGARYRPSHVHVKVSAPGHVPLTTQLYFPDDPYNDGDAFFLRSLVLDMARVRGDLAGRYDFVLRPSAGRG